MMNGHAEDKEGAGGQLAVQERLGPRKLINRTEYVRLLEQALHRLGYPDVANLLEQRTAIPMQPASASAFQDAVLGGRWEAAAALLPSLTQQEAALRECRFLLLQQKYLECLEAGSTGAALACLRTEMAALGAHPAQLHHLAALLLCPAGSDRAARAAWLGGGAAHRGHLLALLQSQLPPQLLLPEGRLELLLEQALEAQISRCPFHNAPRSRLSLLTDYQAGVDCLPTHTVQVLERHTDEVWHVSFSHAGKLLASASKDHTAIVWVVQSPSRLAPLHVLAGHSQPVALTAWSPDDSRLITCSEDSLRVWEVQSGRMLHCFSHHSQAVTCCAWLPDGRRFVSGGTDRLLCLVDLAAMEAAAAAAGAAGEGAGAEGGAAAGGGGGAEAGIQRWKRPYRVQDLAVSPDGCVVVCASADKRSMHLLRLADGREAALEAAPSPIMSLALSPDGTQLLAVLQAGLVQRWELGGAAAAWSAETHMGPDPLDSLPLAPAAEYPFSEGRPLRVILRCGFGGSEASFVVHGGEDSNVYIWHRDSGELLLKLSGHSGTVNSVAWSAANPFMLATASDDKTIRLWLAPAAQQGGAAGGGGGGGGSGGVGADGAGGGRRVALPLLRPGAGAGWAAAAAAAGGGGAGGAGGGGGGGVGGMVGEVAAAPAGPQG